jgi:SAM-dependent methyltransferase
MKLTKPQVGRLERFLERIAKDTYPEPPSGTHEQISEKMLERLWATCTLPEGASVLDVGCGQGVALKHFAARGYDATGIALNPTDVEACRAQGFRVFAMDQSFLEFPDNRFDLVWCRHCIEHSIFPFFTLSEFHRVLKPGGWLYIEVPAPDTACNHQTNMNHYSVLPKSMWGHLIARTGFRIADVVDITFNVPAGPDTYWAFIQQKA